MNAVNENRRRRSLKAEFNRHANPPKVSPTKRPSLQEQVRQLRKLISAPLPSLEMGMMGKVRGTVDRDRDRKVRDKIRKLEARIEKQGLAVKSFQKAQMPGSAKASFNRSARRT